MTSYWKKPVLFTYRVEYNERYVIKSLRVNPKSLSKNRLEYRHCYCSYFLTKTSEQAADS